MNRPHNDLPELEPRDEAFVRRLSEVYSLPRMSASRRVAFQAALEARLHRRRRSFWKPLGAMTAAVAAVGLFVVVQRGTDAGGSAATGAGANPAPTTVAMLGSTPEQTILDIATVSYEGRENDLPADYEAIDNLFLGG